MLKSRIPKKIEFLQITDIGREQEHCQEKGNDGRHAGTEQPAQEKKDAGMMIEKIEEHRLKNTLGVGSMVKKQV